VARGTRPGGGGRSGRGGVGRKAGRNREARRDRRRPGGKAVGTESASRDRAEREAGHEGKAARKESGRGECHSGSRARAAVGADLAPIHRKFGEKRPTRGPLRAGWATSQLVAGKRPTGRKWGLNWVVLQVILLPPVPEVRPFSRGLGALAHACRVRALRCCLFWPGCVGPCSSSLLSFPAWSAGPYLSSLPWGGPY
jgi:hypothetical protein